MSMIAKLFSISALSVELGRDRRTVSKALARVPADGQTETGDPGWFLTTALRALDDRPDGRQRRGGWDEEDEAIRQVEAASDRVSALLNHLRAEPDIKKRRAIVMGGEGRVLGEFERAIERARLFHSEAIRLVEEPYVLQMFGRALSEVLGLCNWQPDPSDVAKPGNRNGPSSAP
jgi:hypothetical protein